MREVLRDVVGELQVLREERVEVALRRRGDAEAAAGSRARPRRAAGRAPRGTRSRSRRWSRARRCADPGSRRAPGGARAARAARAMVSRRSRIALRGRALSALAGLDQPAGAPRRRRPRTRAAASWSRAPRRPAPRSARGRRGGAGTRAPRACRTSRPRGSPCRSPGAARTSSMSSTAIEVMYRRGSASSCAQALARPASPGSVSSKSDCSGCVVVLVAVERVRVAGAALVDEDHVARVVQPREERHHLVGERDRALPRAAREDDDRVGLVRAQPRRDDRDVDARCAGPTSRRGPPRPRSVPQRAGGLDARQAAGCRARSRGAAASGPGVQAASTRHGGRDDEKRFIGMWHEVRRSIAVRRYHSRVATPTFPKRDPAGAGVLGPALRRALRALGRGQGAGAACATSSPRRAPRARARARLRQRVGRALPRRRAAGTCSASISAPRRSQAARADPRAARRSRVRQADFFAPHRRRALRRGVRARLPLRPAAPPVGRLGAARGRARRARRRARGLLLLRRGRARAALPARTRRTSSTGSSSPPSSASTDAAVARFDSGLRGQGALAGLARVRSCVVEEERLRDRRCRAARRRRSRCAALRAAPSRRRAWPPRPPRGATRRRPGSTGRMPIDELGQRPHVLAPVAALHGEVAARDAPRRTGAPRAPRGKAREQALGARASSPRSAPGSRSGCPPRGPRNPRPARTPPRAAAPPHVRLFFDCEHLVSEKVTPKLGITSPRLLQCIRDPSQTQLCCGISTLGGTRLTRMKESHEVQEIRQGTSDDCHLCWRGLRHLVLRAKLFGRLSLCDRNADRLNDRRRASSAASKSTTIPAI